MAIARKQTLVQLSDELVTQLDERAARDRKSRSAVIREAVEQYLEDDIERVISRRIVEGYTRIPQTEAEDPWDDEDALRVIDEEPW